MKRYLILVVVVMLLGSGPLIACTQKQSNAELDSYFHEASLIMDRHVVTTETTNEANRAAFEVYIHGDAVEVIEAYTDYRETLAWALNRTDSELLDFRKLVPPLKARGFHDLMVEGLTKEQAGLTKVLSYYSSVLRYGFGDNGELNDGNALLSEGSEIWLQVQYELRELAKETGLH